MNSSSTIPLAIVVAGVILSGATYLTLKSDTFSGAAQNGSPSLVRPISADDHILGNPIAKVKIIEYSDFDCSHCAIFHNTMHQLINDYGVHGNVAWIFRNFALTEIHPNAKQHAEAAECVARSAGNDSYFKFTDALFANLPTDPTKYAELARASGANPETVAECIQQASTNGITAEVLADRENAVASGATGTPYSVIIVAGKQPIVIESGVPYDTLKEIVDQAML